MQTKTTGLILALCVMIGGMGSVARAQSQLQLILLPAVQDFFAGGNTTFTGTLTNLGGAPLYLNGDGNALNGTGLSLDASPFLNDAPLSLAPNGTPGDSYTGGLFTVSADPSSAPDLYGGSFTVLGGLDSLSTDISSTAPFSVNVVAPVVPEPGVSALLLLGLLPLTVAARRRLTA